MLCAFYEGGGGALLLAKREGHLVEPLAAWASKLDRTRETLVRAALRPADLDERTIQVINALVSFSIWQALIEAGVSHSEASHVIRRLVLSCIRETTP